MNLALQKSWRDSDDKCTFIVISAPDGSGASRSSAADLSAEIDNMVGDTNLFLQESTGESCYISRGPLDIYTRKIESSPFLGEMARIPCPLASAKIW